MTQEEVKKVIETSDKLVLVDFYANWCSPCMMLKPHVEKVSEDMGEDVEVLFIDVDQFRETAKDFEVKSIPALFLYKNGELVEDKTINKENIVSKIEQHR